MFEEFSDLMDNVMALDDKMFDTLVANDSDNFNSIFNYEDIGNYTRMSLDSFRDMNYSIEEYNHEIEMTRDAMQELRNMVAEKVTSEAKRAFFNKVLQTMAATIETAIAETDYYHVHIAVEKINPDAQLPTYAHPWDAGADVYAVRDDVLTAGATKIIPTGLKVSIPRGWMLSVRPRSGMSAKTGMRVANAPGTIDTGYLDEVGIIMTNTSNANYTIHKGDRIAQFVVERKWNAEFVPVESVNDVADDNRSNENGAGYGSTGK